MKRALSTIGVLLTVTAVLMGLLAMPLSVFGQFNDDVLDWNESEEAAYYTYAVSYNTATITAVDPSLIGAVTVPSFLGGFPVVAIGDSAFAGCGGITALTVTEGITALGVAAFSGCTALESVVLPESIKEIPVAAFSGCAALTEITLPASLKTVGVTAFTGCVALTDVYYGGLETDRGAMAIQSPNTELLNATWHYDEIPATPESHLYYTYTTEEGKATIVAADKKLAGNVTVPTLLGGCPVVAIEDEAFAECTLLTGLVLPAGLSTIGDGAFSDCTALVSVALPAGLSSMGEWAFSGCESLTTIRLPDALSVIGDWAFEHCGALAAVEFGDRVTNIGIGAFRYCTALTAVTLPETVAMVEGWAFDGCTSLAQVTFGEALRVIDDCAFQNCTALTAVAIPDGAHTVGDAAFAGCTALAQVTLPAAVTRLNNDVFYGCGALTALTLPVGVTAIGEKALSACGGLTTLTLPITVETVAEAAFFGCDSLTDVYYAGTEAQQQAVEIAAGNLPLQRATWHCAAVPDQPAEPEEPCFAVSSEQADAGSTVALTVRVENNPGIAAAAVTLRFDGAVLALSDVSGVDFGAVEILASDPQSVTILWVGEDGNNSEDGVLAQLVFTVKNTTKATVAAVELSYDPLDVYNAAWESVPFAVRSGSVTVIPTPTQLPGDVNSDGKQNNKDLVLLLRYLNGWNVIVDEDHADVDGNGKLSTADILLLQQYLNGWDVELK